MATTSAVVDAMEIFLFKLKPNTVYNVTLSGQGAPMGSFRTNEAGMANGTMMGPLRPPRLMTRKAIAVFVGDRDRTTAACW